MPRPSPSSSLFPKTLWSKVVSAGRGSDSALQTLAAAYRPVVLRLVAWFVRNPAALGTDPEDLTQDFFLHLTRRRAEILGRADAARGRFRAWLRTCLSHWLHNRIDELRARKRLGERPGRALAGLEEAFPGSSELDREFDRQWARDVFDRVAARMRAQVGSGRLHAEDLDVWSLKSADPDLSERAIAERVGLSENFVHASLRRVRKEYADLLRSEVASTVSSASELEAEIAELLRCAGGG